MNEFIKLEEVAQVLGDGGAFNPDTVFKTMEELVDALVDLGHTDKVFALHDDFLGLKSCLSEKFLKLPLSDTKIVEFEPDIAAVLKEANIIIPLFNRELSEDDIEEIREDLISRGYNSDE